MSITIKVEPQDLSPTYNEIIMVLDSTKKTEESFEWIIDINVGKTTAGLTFSNRLKVSPDPTGYGVVDLHRTIEAFISFDLDTSATKTFSQAPNSYSYYDVDLFESYILVIENATATNSSGFITIQDTTEHQLSIGDKIIISNSTVTDYNGTATVTAVTSSTIIVVDVVYSANATLDYTRADGSATIIKDNSAVFSSDKIASNSTFEFEDYIDYDGDDYTSATSSVANLLTQLDTTHEVQIDDRFWLDSYSDSIRVQHLNIISDNGTFKINNVYNANDDSKLLRVAYGPWNIINNTDSITVVSGALPVLDVSSTSYTAQLVDSSNVPVSELRTFNIVDTCTIYETYQMIFMDELGSFLSVNFDRKSNESRKIKRTKYKKNYGEYNPTTNTWGYSSSDRGDKIIDTVITTNITINSNWVTEKQSDLINLMIESPEVYHLTEIEYDFTESTKVFNYGNSGGFSKYTAAVALGYSIGDIVRISGMNVDSLNSLQEVTSIPSANSFTTSKPFVASGAPNPSDATTEKRIILKAAKLRAVSILDSSTKKNKIVNETAFNHKVKFEYAFKSGKQRG